MTVEEMISRWPGCRPLFTVGPFGVWFLDERWRLPYRWCEFKRGAVMLFGFAVLVIRLREAHHAD